MKKRVIAILVVFVLLLCGCHTNENAFSQPVNCSHADEDDNGTCDLCSANVVVTIDLYHVNDLHGKIADGEEHPGVDELSTYLQHARDKSENMLLLSSGDMWQGSNESNMTGGLIVTDWMNEMHFAAMTLGEHELGWGEERILENLEQANFPFLAINVYDRETDRQVSYCQSSTLINFGSVQIGVIGAVGDSYSDISPDRVENIYFKTGEELTELIKEECRRLRARGAEFVVLSMHNGYDPDFYDISLSYGYVDLVLEGRSHQKYELKDSHGVYHLQGGGDNQAINHAKIWINTVTGTHFVTDQEFLNTTTYDEMRPYSIVDRLLRKYEAQIAPSKETIGYNRSELDRDQLRKTVAQLYLWEGMQKWGREYDIVLGGGMLSIRSPYVLQSGDVNYAMLQTLFPQENELMLCSLRGSELDKLFISVENKNFFIARADDRSIEPEAMYFVVIDAYTYSLVSDYVTLVARYGAGVYARDLLADYIAAGKLAE